MINIYCPQGFHFGDFFVYNYKHNAMFIARNEVTWQSLTDAQEIPTVALLL